MGHQDFYPQLEEKKETILEELSLEEKRFEKTLEKGLKEFRKINNKLARGKKITGEEAFYLYETYGFPLELTEELAAEKKMKVDRTGFLKAQKRHQEKSRASLEKKFAGGLADHSATVMKLHTATHLLHRALRDVLGNHVQQIGSNITPERLRFDFTHPEKLAEAQVREVEKVINEKIKANLPVKMEMMSLAEARKKGALAFFAEKYGDKVKVYSIGDYSKEVCGGPHVSSTGEIGGVKITKEKPVGAGKRRLYIVLAHGS